MFHIWKNLYHICNSQGTDELYTRVRDKRISSNSPKEAYSPIALSRTRVCVCKTFFIVLFWAFRRLPSSWKSVLRAFSGFQVVGRVRDKKISSNSLFGTYGLDNFIPNSRNKLGKLSHDKALLIVGCRLSRGLYHTTDSMSSSKNYFIFIFSLWKQKKSLLISLYPQ